MTSFPKKTCPHPDISKCPLYVISHGASGYGCAGAGDGDFCEVELGTKSYEVELEAAIRARATGYECVLKLVPVAGRA